MSAQPNDAPSLSERFVLSEPELVMCRTLGLMRHLCARGGHVATRQYGEQSAYEIDIDGVLGEYAFARMMNLCPDFTVSERNGGHDLRTRKGATVDVKTTRYANGKLMGEMKKRAAYSDVYVLMVVDDRSALFAGWAYGKELFDERNLGDLGHGPTYLLPQSALRRDFGVAS